MKACDCNDYSKCSISTKCFPGYSPHGFPSWVLPVGVLAPTLLSSSCEGCAATSLGARVRSGISGVSGLIFLGRSFLESASAIVFSAPGRYCICPLIYGRVISRVDAKPNKGGETKLFGQRFMVL